MRRIETGPSEPCRVLVCEWLGIHGPETWIGDPVASRGNELPGGNHRVRRRSVFGVQARLGKVLEQVESRRERRAAVNGRSTGVDGIIAIRRRYRLAISREVAPHVRQLDRI